MPDMQNCNCIKIGAVNTKLNLAKDSWITHVLFCDNVKGVEDQVREDGRP
jgi:hypothetical protein